VKAKCILFSTGIRETTQDLERLRSTLRRYTGSVFTRGFFTGIQLRSPVQRAGSSPSRSRELNYLLRCGGFPEVIAPASICPSRRRICYEAVVATGKPVVLVLTNGCALAVNWAKEHVNAILEAWYPGEEGGTPIAETLSGKNNPAGRLPVTFYTSVDQLPSFESYAMKGRTYRYFEGTPLYPFGYGLSYTTFSYSDLTLPTSVITAGQPMTAEVTVTNKGKLAGDEVAQLYLSFPNVAGGAHPCAARFPMRAPSIRANPRSCVSS
jgi:Glycosyl hydrolase family 3 C-terminal domain